MSNNQPLEEFRSNNKYTLFPIDHKEVYELYKTHCKTIWFPAEIDFSRDGKDWLKLKPSEQKFIKHVLAFFAGSDGIVMENLAQRFMREIPFTEAVLFYSVQNFMECVHSETYSLLIDMYVKDAQEKDLLFNAIETFPAIKKKADWALKWIESDRSIKERIIAFSAVEGIFFSGSFCCIYWLKERGIMPGLCLSNDFIARDEGLHTDMAVLLYSKFVKDKLPLETVKDILKSAVDIEKEFITESLPCSLLGMNAGLMVQYIEFVANRLMKQLTGEGLYDKDIKQPFNFMDRICLKSQVNFFERYNSDYQKSVDTGSKEETLELLEDF